MAGSFSEGSRAPLCRGKVTNLVGNFFELARQGNADVTSRAKFTIVEERGRRRGKLSGKEEETNAGKGSRSNSERQRDEDEST